MKRGDVVIVSPPGSYGKPRPSVVVQSDVFPETGSVTVLLMTSRLRPDVPMVRHRLLPSEGNGLQVATDVMIDTLASIRRRHFGPTIGRLGGQEMAAITAAMAIFLGM